MKKKLYYWWWYKMKITPAPLCTNLKEEKNNTMRIIRIVSTIFIIKKVCWRGPEGDPRNTPEIPLS